MLDLNWKERGERERERRGEGGKGLEKRSKSVKERSVNRIASLTRTILPVFSGTLELRLLVLNILKQMAGTKLSFLKFVWIKS